MVVDPRATLLEALRAINDGAHGIAFVSGIGDRVSGAVTDGDIRRGLLSGAALDSRSLSQVMRRDFTWVSEDSGRAEVLDLMRARGIAQVPILDGRGRLVGLHTIGELIGAGERPNWALLMAGGRGERLRPLTLRTPKPMLLVAGRPILERLVLHLVGHGIRRVFISVNHLAGVIERHFRDGARFGCRIEYLRERRALGTGGAVSLLPRRPKDPLVVLNGDLVTQVDIGRLLRFHEDGGFVVSTALQGHAASVPYGVAEVRGRRLVALREKPTLRMLINAGIYVLSPRAVRLVPRGKEYPMTQLLQTCLERKLAVGAHVIEDDWQDIGRPDELRRARGET